MSDYTYDVTIIGSGPGGYVAAIRAAQLGFKTAIIERYDTLGGTCLNVGCIPSKALLDSSHHYHDAQHKFAEHGIQLKSLKVDMPQMIKRKAEVVKATTDGVDFLMNKNKIDVFHGHGSFKDAHTIVIDGKEGPKEITTDKTIIATGSKPSSVPGVEVDKKRIITSTEGLEIKEVPKKMIVIGAGVIGLEIGSVFARLGTEIEVIEYTDKAIGAMDGAMGREIKKILGKELGFKFSFNHKVTSASSDGKKVKVTAENMKSGETVEFEGDYCLVATGRRPYTDNLGLDKAGVKLDDRGRVEVDGHLQTNVPGIYAIGDVVKGAMLAHKASEEGVFVAEVIAGQHPHINYRAIPNVVYTWPEVAGVGFTEEELKADKIPYKSGNFYFRASGRARASMDTDGLVKVLSHKDTDELLGMHIIGPRAADMIMEGVMGLEFRASAEDIAIFSHPHPTFSESIKEAAMDATGGRAIHK